MQFRKKLVFSMVLRFSLFGKNIILPNLQGILQCFRSAKPVVYAVHAHCMQCHAAMAIRCLGLRAISHGARWCGVCVSFDVSGCTPPPLPPGGRKNGAALRRQPMRYDTQPFETSRQTSSRSTFIASYTQVNRKLIASYTFFTSFQRNSIHYLGDMHLVFATFELYYK